MVPNENEQTETTQLEAEGPQEQEQAPTNEAPPEEAEAKGEEDGSAEAKEETEPQEEPAKPPEKHRRAGGWQRKIEHLERLNETLMQQLNQRQPQATEPAKEKTPDEKAAEYVNNIVEQRLAQKEAERRQQQAAAEFQRRQAEARAAHPDYDEVLLSSDMPVSQALQQVLLTSEQGPAIMYQLAKNPAELARISALPPLDAAREIGRLEAKASSTATPKTTTKSATRPPAPPTSVNGSTSSTRRLEDLSIADYKRAMRSGRR